MVNLISQGDGMAIFQGGGQQLTIDANACIMCEECEIVCPNSAIFFEEGYVGDGNYEALAYVGMKFKANDCDLQGDCVMACPMNALVIRSMEAEPPEEFEPGEGEAPLRDITNNLTTPCLSSVFNQINSNNGLQTQIGSILHDTFGIWDQANLEITEVTNLANDINGQTECERRGEFFDAKVKLNANTLPYASKEYIAGTICHEILHGYLGYKNVTTKLQHNATANEYLVSIMDTLQHFFPGLSRNDAEALAWCGLEGTTALNDLITNDPNKYNDILDRQAKLRDGRKGTRCPQ